MTKKYKKFLENIVKEYCDTGKYILYPDYSDKIPVQIIEKSYERALKYGDDFEETLENEVCSSLIDDAEYIFTDLIYKKADQSEDTEIIASVRADDSLFENLCTCGFKGYDFSFNALLKQTSLCLTIKLGTAQEQNYDMSSIISAYGCWRMPYTEDMNEKAFDNALTYLIHQQGHSIKDIFDCLVASPRGFEDTDDGEFVKSVVNEIVNNSSEGLSEVVILLKLSGDDIVDFFDTLIKKDCSFQIPFEQGVTLGLFNEWDGCGSLLDIKLEKDFVFSPELIRDVGVSEDSDNLVGEVYGISDEFWKDIPIIYTKDASDLYKEGNDIFREIKKLISSDENDVA